MRKDVKGHVSPLVNQGWEDAAGSVQRQLPVGSEMLDSCYTKTSLRNVFTKACEGTQWPSLGTPKGSSHFKREIGIASLKITCM